MVIKAIVKGTPEKVDVRLSSDKYQVLFLPVSLLNAIARKKSKTNPTVADNIVTHKLFLIATR